MSEPKLSNLPYIFAYLLVGIILGFFFGYGLYNIIHPAPGQSTTENMLLLTVAGAFGGLFYAMRDRQLEVPHKKSDNDNYINPGLLVDCFAGVAGAYVIFLISPVKLEELESIKILATGMLGGYGGRVLLDQALKGILKEDFEKLKTQVIENKEKINSTEEENKSGAKALATLDLYFDPQYHFSPDREEELKQEIQAASYSSKVIIFTKAREFRVANMFKNKKLMERAILVFQALIDSDTEKKDHRNYGQISCIYRDKNPPDWMKVKQNFMEAIKIRDRFEENQKHEIFWIYELFLAVSTIETTSDDEKEIWKNLTAANRYVKNGFGEAQTNLWKEIGKLDEKFDREAEEANVKRENLQKLIEEWIARNTPNYSLQELQ